MKEQVLITGAEAFEAIKLIQQYLTQGGTGFDEAKLCTVLAALSEAETIRIIDHGESQ